MSSDALESQLGYRFKDRGLLSQALTHKSAGSPHNERLEFLGDAVLGYIVAEMLFLDQPNNREDVLTLSRAELVRKETLAEIATELGMGRALKLGQSAASSGGHRNQSILADALEAVIGAIHQDGGIEAAHQFVTTHWKNRSIATSSASLKDPKTRLQEWLQARGKPLPEYAVVNTEGAEHKKLYEVHCRVEDEAEPGIGIDSSRRKAEKAAAASLLERLE